MHECYHSWEGLETMREGKLARADLGWHTSETILLFLGEHHKIWNPAGGGGGGVGGGIFIGVGL